MHSYVTYTSQTKTVLLYNNSLGLRGDAAFQKEEEEEEEDSD